MLLFTTDMVKCEAGLTKQGAKEYTVAEAATYMGRSIEQVRRNLRDGALVGYRTGQQWFVPPVAVATF